MKYCSNCGSRLEDDAAFCSFCGVEFNINKELIDKDKKIQELEKKVALLEKQIITEMKSRTFSEKGNYRFGWQMIVPIICFFAFMIILVLILKMS